MADLAHRTGFTAVDRTDVRSRLQFSVVAAAAICSVTPYKALLHMTSDPDGLMPYLKGELAGHALQDEDYRRIYRIIKHRALNPDLSPTPEQMERM